MSKTRWWIVEVEEGIYLKSSSGETVTLKGQAGRVRDTEINTMREMVERAGMDFKYIPTTFKTGKMEFISPRIWYWINMPSTEED